MSFLKVFWKRAKGNEPTRFSRVQAMWTRGEMPMDIIEEKAFIVVGASSLWAFDVICLFGRIDSCLPFFPSITLPRRENGLKINFHSTFRSQVSNNLIKSDTSRPPSNDDDLNINQSERIGLRARVTNISTGKTEWENK